MAKMENIGECRLCKKQKLLVSSHLLPRGIFKRLRANDKEPFVVTGRISLQTSRQIRDLLLCEDCERLFDRNGEDYVLRQMCRGTEFPLLERINVSPPADFSLNREIYSGERIGLDTEKLAYFALSVLWRSAAHEWPDFPNVGGYKIELPPTFMESIRRYLLGWEFPHHVAVMVTACKDRVSQNAAFKPARIPGIANTGFAFLACGIHFMVYLGPMSPALHNLCCFSSSKRLIFARDIQEHTANAYEALAVTARSVGSANALD